MEVTEFNEADPPVGGLRTWPQIRTTKPDQPDVIHKLHNLTTAIKKQARHKRLIPPQSGIFGTLLKQARELGADHSIHAYSRSPYRSRRDSLEVAWGVHVHKLRRKTRSGPLVCGKCKQKLTNTHLLGGCPSTAKLRISRHHSTFKLLHHLLSQTTQGVLGRCAQPARRLARAVRCGGQRVARGAARRPAGRGGA